MWAKPNCMLTHGCPIGVHLPTLLGAHQCSAKGCTWIGIDYGWDWNDNSEAEGDTCPAGRYWGRRKVHQGAGISCIKLYLCKGLTWNLNPCNSGILRALKAVNQGLLSAVMKTSQEKTPPQPKALWKHPPSFCSTSQSFQWEKWSVLPNFHPKPLCIFSNT